MNTGYTNGEERELERLADEALALLGGRLLRETRCGRGASGAVWLAREEMTQRRVAVKVVRKDDANVWRREYTGVRHFCEHVRHVHPHLLVIHHLAENDRFFCYSMEAADNVHAADIYQPDTLGYRLRNGEPLPLSDVRRYGAQLMEALLSLHEAGLVHRDLKPDNIVFVDGEPKIADIGLVSLIHPELSVVGTPGYIPQNQLDNAEPDGIAQDIYALGKILYGCMSGYSANHFPKMPAAVTAHPLSLPLNNAILTACHPNPARRFPNIREFLAAWNTAPAAPRYEQLQGLLWRVAIVVLFLIVAGLSFFFSRTDTARNPPVTPSSPPSVFKPFENIIFEEA